MMAFESRLAAAFPGRLAVHGFDPGHDDQAIPADAEVLVTLGVHLGAQSDRVFAAAPDLKWVQLVGVGTDNVLGHPKLAADVAITNIRGLHGPQMSEAAFAAMLSFARETPRLVRNQDRATWERFPARRLYGRTVGIVGMGAIAADLAPRCQAFGMTVVGFSASNRPTPGFDRIFDRADIARHAAEIDYLVVLTPHTPQTHHMIDAEVLAALGSDGVLVNLARGGVVDETALLAALAKGTIRGAALDVFETEPLRSDHPFWTLSNVVVTPHLGGFHADYGDEVVAIVIDNMERYLSGGIGTLTNRLSRPKVP